jgi:hypothetical protein
MDSRRDKKCNLSLSTTFKLISYIPVGSRIYCNNWVNLTSLLKGQVYRAFIGFIG